MYTSITVFFLIIYFICITNGIDIGKIQKGGGIQFNELFSKLSNNPGKTAGVVIGLIFLIGLIVYFSMGSDITTDTPSVPTPSVPPPTDTPEPAPATAPGKCSNNPCRNGANCIDIDENNYSCVCPQGYSGPNCETSSDTAGVDITVVDTTFERRGRRGGGGRSGGGGRNSDKKCNSFTPCSGIRILNPANYDTPCPSSGCTDTLCCKNPDTPADTCDSYDGCVLPNTKK